MSGKRFPGWMPQILTLLLCTWLVALTHHAQARKPPAGQSPPQTAKIRAEVGLVQTDILARQGRFDDQRTRPVVDMSREELLLAYPEQMRGLDFGDPPPDFSSFLASTGEKVEAFFKDLPKILSREQVRFERLDSGGKLQDSTTRTYYYSFSPDKTGAYWEEARTETSGRPIESTKIFGFSLAPGRTGMTAFLHPRHQPHCRFRFLGTQKVDAAEASVIAFAQKPEDRDYLGYYLNETMVEPLPVLYQGFVWVDPATHQIVRMQIDLLEPRSDVGLTRQTSEIWFSEVRFKSSPEPFWVPREVLITTTAFGFTYRNRHRYSDYQIFTVSVEEKITLPPVKK